MEQLVRNISMTNTISQFTCDKTESFHLSPSIFSETKQNTTRTDEHYAKITKAPT